MEQDKRQITDFTDLELANALRGALGQHANLTAAINGINKELDRRSQVNEPPKLTPIKTTKKK